MTNTQEEWDNVPNIFDGGEGLKLRNGEYLLQEHEYQRFKLDNVTITCSINVEECITDIDLQTLHEIDNKEISESTCNEFMRLFCWHNKQGFGNMPPEYRKPPHQNTYWVSSVVHCSTSSSTGASEFEVKRDLNGIVSSTKDDIWKTTPDDETKVMLTHASQQVQTVLIPIIHDDTGKYILAVLFLDKAKIVVYDIDNTDELPDSVKSVIDVGLKDFWKTIQESRTNDGTFTKNVEHKSYVSRDVNTSEQVIYTMLRIIKHKIHEEDEFVKDENANKMKKWIAFVLFIFSKKEIKIEKSGLELCKSATKDKENHSMRILSERIQAL